MRWAFLFCALLSGGCEGDADPGDDAADDDASSSSGSTSDASEASSSDGSSDSGAAEAVCRAGYDACMADGTAYLDCVDAYAECYPDAGADWEACKETVETCAWNCCPYERGSVQWAAYCVNDEVNACTDTCGGFRLCDPFPDND